MSTISAPNAAPLSATGQGVEGPLPPRPWLLPAVLLGVVAAWGYVMGMDRAVARSWQKASGTRTLLLILSVFLPLRSFFVFLVLDVLVFFFFFFFFATGSLVARTSFYNIR